MRRTLLATAVATAAATTVAALIVNVDASHDRKREETEACERRETIVEAVSVLADTTRQVFDGLIEGLVSAGEGVERTPEEEARRQEQVAAFRALMAERLEPLENMAERLNPLLPIDC